MISIFHGTDLLPFKTFHPFKWFTAGHHPETLIRHTEELISCILINFLNTFLKTGIINGIPRLLYILKCTGSVEDAQFRHKADLWRRRLHYKRNIAVLTALHQFPVSSKGTLRIYLDFHLSVT